MAKNKKSPGKTETKVRTPKIDKAARHKRKAEAKRKRGMKVPRGTARALARADLPRQVSE